jgi:hypothetical protein
MQKVLVSIPDNLFSRMKVLIPSRQRSKVISNLIEKEIKRREKILYECACEVEKDEALNKEMEDWNVTAGDGIGPEIYWVNLDPTTGSEN